MAKERDWEESSLGERLKHALKLRGWSVNHLGKVTGLTGGPVSRLSRRTERTAGSPDGLIKIADALKVELRWLADGRGPIERHQQTRTADERRALAAELAREDGIQDAAIEAVLAEEIRGEDAQRSTMWWGRRIRARDVEMESGVLPATTIRRKKA